jgi:Protein of unknown function (DUF3575).
MIHNRFIVINSTPKPQPENRSRTSDRYARSNPEELSTLVLVPREQIDSVTTALEIPSESVEVIPETRQEVLPYSDYHRPDFYRTLVDHQPGWALKTNLLYGAAALAPNLAVEFGTGRKTTLELSAGYNGWNRRGTKDNNRKLVHFTARAEYRYWFCERYNGHFIGGHAFFNHFNISEYAIPVVGFKKSHRYEGHAGGIGFTYGYQLPLGERWGAEFSVGVGAAYMDYEQFDCVRCSYPGTPKTKFYIGPTRIGVSLVYLIK